MTPLFVLVREYFHKKAKLDSYAGGRNLQLKGAAREKARAKAQREFDAVDGQLRAAVGIDGVGDLVAHKLKFELVRGIGFARCSCSCGFRGNDDEIATHIALERAVAP